MQYSCVHEMFTRDPSKNVSQQLWDRDPLGWKPLN